MSRPDPSTIPEWYHKYVSRVKENDAMEAIKADTFRSLEFLEKIPGEKWTYRYAEGKWSVKEMIQHLIDSERIFSYRALCIARGEKASLPGFDENAYATASRADLRPQEDLIAEFALVRKATEALFASFSETQFSATGIANNNPVTVNGIGFIIPGHVQHHLAVLAERYL